MKVLLISTYELGRQPFGLASPAAWLREAGFEVAALDLSQCKLDEPLVRSSELVAFYLPMHTATRIALRAIERVRALNPDAHLCCFGLYAPMNAELLRASGVASVLGGEFEQELLDLAKSLRRDTPIPAPVAVSARSVTEPAEVASSPHLPSSSDIPRLKFIVPDRSGLPPLDKYARLSLPTGEQRVVGYTEASRGCKHRCRHCPIVPIYDGQFRVVPKDVVLEDIRRQVAAGAEHLTFGDPDFFNGPAHAVELVRGLHREFPALSYDVTVKVEHLLKHSGLLPLLRDTGCAFVTSAVESLDDRVLAMLDKGHTRADFLRVVAVMRDAGLPLSPTFVPFTPWTTLENYGDLLQTLASLDLVENVSPVQLAIRLLIPAGSRLLELPEVREAIDPFDAHALSYPWRTPDPQVDELQREIEGFVDRMSRRHESRSAIFAEVCRTVEHLAQAAIEFPPQPPMAARATIPYLTEPWYC